MHFYNRVLGKTLVYLIMFSSLGCNGNIRNNTTEDDIETKVDSLLSLMTFDERISLLHANSKFTTSAIERLGIPEWTMSDGPHGIRAEIERHSWNYAGLTNDSSTYFPTGTALAATWNPSLALAMGQALGEEARARGKDILLGPGVNIQRTPLCGRNFEYMSEDPLLNAKLSVPYITGVQSKDVAACIKHYAVNNQETDRNEIDVEVGERALREIYLPAFKAAVQEGNVYAVMGAYNKFRGVYCCENGYLLRDILREQWGFRGVVISDWNATHSTIDAANNGLDIEMGTDVDSYDKYYFATPLKKAIKDGNVAQEVIDQKVRSILRVMIQTKIFDSERTKGEYNTPEHYITAYKIASEAIVLLKNDRDMLPLDQTKIKSIAVIGDNATRKHSEGGYSSGVKAKREITPLEGLKQLLGESVKLNFVQGYKKKSNLRDFILTENNKLDRSLMNEAVQMASKSEIAIVFAGLNHDYDTEGLDKMSMTLPYQQDQLIKAVLEVNPNTIVVIHAGSPVDMSKFANNVSALVWGWYNGSEGGRAIADVIFGQVNPSGKMPFTLPVTLDDSPAHAMGNFPGTNKLVKYQEELLIGYRWFDTKNIKPLYAFGHGLSYTEFGISKINTNKTVFKRDEFAEVMVTVTNNGKVDGAEILQLYCKDEESSVFRPKKELRAFQKVFLKAGEQKEVVLKFNINDLAFFDKKTGDWNLESGVFLVLVGNAADNIITSTTIEVN